MRAKPNAISSEKRARLVNFLIEVQEGFELNHETLYLAVKLLDLFLSRVQKIDKTLPMLGAVVSIFVAAKMEVCTKFFFTIFLEVHRMSCFQERSVPTIDDLLYMVQQGNSARYAPEQMKALERDFLRTVGYDLGAPLSYSFLRRYARVLKLSMQVLTTARFYLESSLHSLDFCRVSDSRIAAAALLLALRVTQAGDWVSLPVMQSKNTRLCTFYYRFLFCSATLSSNAAATRCSRSSRSCGTSITWRIAFKSHFRLQKPSSKNMLTRTSNEIASV